MKKRLIFILALTILFVLAMTCFAFAEEGYIKVDGLKAPDTGKMPSFNAKVSGNYTIEYVKWDKGLPETNLATNDKFEALTKYYLKMKIKKTDGEFETLPDIYVAGAYTSDGEEGTVEFDTNDRSIVLVNMSFPPTNPKDFTLAHFDGNGNYDEEVTFDRESSDNISIKPYTSSGEYLGKVEYKWYKSNKAGEYDSNAVIGTKKYLDTTKYLKNGGIYWFKCIGKNAEGKTDDILIKVTHKVNILDECKIDVKNVAYNGKSGRKPNIKITVAKTGKVLTQGTHYTLHFAKKAAYRKKVGTYKFTIDGKGKYYYYYEETDGDYTYYTFRINPKSTKIYSKAALKGGFKIKWYKRTKQTSGYEVRYSTTSKFKSGTYKTKTIKDTSRKYFVKRNLKKGKAYYVKVRTYKVVNGNKYYSKWSKTQKIVTKR